MDAERCVLRCRSRRKNSRLWLAAVGLLLLTVVVFSGYLLGLWPPSRLAGGRE